LFVGVEMDWEEVLDEYGSLIERRLISFLEGVIADAGAYHPFVERVYGDLHEYLSRKGKRLASCSTLLTYKGYHGSLDDRILDVCVGVELYRHCILVHDDFVDGDETRRTGKTIHRIYSESYDDRFGGGVAVFAGNALYTLALRAILESGFEKEKIWEAVNLLAEGYCAVNESQILDLLFEHKEPDVEEWRVMASQRAASLFKATMLMGALLGDAPKQDLKRLEEAASHIGYAFDIQDDIIDTYATEEQYGRPPGGDIARGKKPLHIIEALEQASKEQSSALRRMLKGKSVSKEELRWVKTMVRYSGALETAKERSREHAEMAKKLISATAMKEETKRFFTSFITYVEESLNWYR
jgi:geranylgeranyl pyrophosphate synthase